MWSSGSSGGPAGRLLGNLYFQAVFLQEGFPNVSPYIVNVRHLQVANYEDSSPFFCEVFGHILNIFKDSSSALTRTNPRFRMTHGQEQSCQGRVAGSCRLQDGALGGYR